MMKPSLHILECTEVPIFEQLQWEEALLRADNRNWCLINHGSPPAIVLGISGKVEHHVNQEKFDRNPIPLIRRFSGGGTVVVDEDTIFVTFICQAADISIAPFPRALLKWSADIYAPLFSSHPFQLCENDYTVGNKKWGGNAQSIIKGRWLHHSSLLWDFNPDRMSYLHMPPKTPAYRNGRHHHDFLCRLSDFLPNLDVFKNSLLENLSSQFHLLKSEIKEVEVITQRPHRKTTVCLDSDDPK